MKQKHSEIISIPFHLCDPAGVLFFGNIFGLAHSVYENWISESAKKLGGWNFWFNNPDWIVPIKIAQAEYLGPMKAGEKIKVTIFIKSNSESSFTLATEFSAANGPSTSDKGSTLHARVETTHVFCNRALFKKTPMSPEAKAFLTQ